MTYDTIKMNPGDAILLRWDINHYDSNVMNKIVDYLHDSFPQNSVAALPKDIDLSIIKSDDQFDF